MQETSVVACVVHLSCSILPAAVFLYEAKCAVVTPDKADTGGYSCMVSGHAPLSNMICYNPSTDGAWMVLACTYFGNVLSSMNHLFHHFIDEYLNTLLCPCAHAALDSKAGYMP